MCDNSMKRILIVDDQKMYLSSLELVLKKHFNVKIASSYDDAITELSSDFDIALIDIRLNEYDDNNKDGLKILEWISMNKPEISVFIMSSYKEFEYAEQSLNLGARHFFRKPIDISSLIAIIKEKA